MAKLSPGLKFVVINLDDFVILVIALAIIYWLLPIYFVPLALILVVGFIILIAVKYRLLYTALNDEPRNYDVTEMIGEAISTITPSEGHIRLGAEIWHARSKDIEIPAGSRVRVVSRDGMVLQVTPIDPH
ncbi:MAG: NfeD family protein [Candidatus Thorarchaeota archaeon]|nr:NfeD family protein [Candidatus Thorarchaeota archaeon]